MKKCPFCAEEIQDEAVKCRFCGEFLDGRGEGPLQNKKNKWYFRASTLIAGFILAGPCILPLIWFHPRYSKTKKIVLSSILIVITVFLYKALKVSLASIDQYYQLLQGRY